MVRDVICVLHCRSVKLARSLKVSLCTVIYIYCMLYALWRRVLWLPLLLW